MPSRHICGDAHNALSEFRSSTLHWLHHASESQSSLRALYSICFELREVDTGVCLGEGAEALHDHVVYSTDRKVTSPVIMSRKQKTP